MRLRFWIFLLFVGVFTQVDAQFNFVSGYIITNEGDTLRGKIKNTTPAQRSTNIVFLETGEDKKVKYKPFQIKGFHLEGWDYESKIYDFNPALPYGYAVFMERINQGTVKVYYYWNTDKERGFTQTFIENDGDYLVEIDALRFKKQMERYFEEYSRLKNKIKRGEYRKKDLMEIVAEYNKWKDEAW